MKALTGQIVKAFVFGGVALLLFASAGLLFNFCAYLVWLSATPTEIPTHVLQRRFNLWLVIACASTLFGFFSAWRCLIALRTLKSRVGLLPNRRLILATHERIYDSLRRAGHSRSQRRRASIASRHAVASRSLSVKGSG